MGWWWQPSTKSFLDTFALVTLFDDPTFILKRELMWIPFFGWYTRKAGSVSVNRKAGSQALLQMTARAREEAKRGRQILIFPEGTRRPAGAPPAYKFGVAHLYQNLGVSCVPVALNSGLYWPRRRFIRRPGTIRVEILRPNSAGPAPRRLLQADAGGDRDGVRPTPEGGRSGTGTGPTRDEAAVTVE